MSIFERFFFFESYIDFSFEKFFLWIFMKFVSIFGRFFFFLVKLIFYFNIFFYECSWSFRVFSKDYSFFESYIDFSFERKFFYEFSWSLWVFLEDFSFFLVKLIFYFKKFFLWVFMKFMSIFERFFFFWVIYWFFISYSMAHRTSTEVLRIIRPCTERVNYLDYLDCLNVMNFLVNVCIFPLSKKR